MGIDDLDRDGANIVYLHPVHLSLHVDLGQEQMHGSTMNDDNVKCVVLKIQSRKL